MKGRALATGRRKASSARVWLWHGSGDFSVNGKPLGRYFEQQAQRAAALAPLTALNAPAGYTVMSKVEGGGASPCCVWWSLVGPGWCGWPCWLTARAPGKQCMDAWQQRLPSCFVSAGWCVMQRENDAEGSSVKVHAGRKGQAEAIQLGVARALVKLEPEHHKALKALGLLVRDPRVVEPKKPARKKARKKRQWVKR